MAATVGRTRTSLPEGAAPMTSAPVRDPLADHRLTPAGCSAPAHRLPGPAKLVGLFHSMDRALPVKKQKVSRAGHKTWRTAG